jgi:hypothetical protein
MKNAYKLYSGNIKGRGHLEHFGAHGNIILKQALKQVSECGLNSSGSED